MEPGTYVVTYTDPNANPTTFTYTYVYHVAMPGVFDINPTAGGTIIHCTSEINENLITLPTVKDYCGASKFDVFSGPDISNFPACEGVVTYTYTYKDCAGNYGHWVFSFHITKTPLVFPTWSNYSQVECIGDAVVPTPPTVLDDCGVEVIPTGPVASDDQNACLHMVVIKPIPGLIWIILRNQ